MTGGQINRIAVVGAGRMGHGIAQGFAQAGRSVVLHDSVEENLEKALERIEGNLRELADWGVFPPDTIHPTMKRIEVTPVLKRAAADVDFVVEAVYEDLSLKQQVFHDLDAFCPSHTILSSNTSSLMPSSLAAKTRRPDRVLVTHYFYPPHLLPLVEIVRSPSTSQTTIDAVYALLKASGKSPIIVQKEALGFIANRLQVALLREALYLIEKGIATAQEIDTAVKDSFGRRLAVAGPVETLEIQDGWDVCLQIEKYILPDLDRSTEPSPVIREKVARGELGEKTGRGFYEWSPDFAEMWKRRMAKALSGYLTSPTGEGTHQAGADSADGL